VVNLTRTEDWRWHRQG